jgi:hypothetical protein
MRFASVVSKSSENEPLAKSSKWRWLIATMSTGALWTYFATQLGLLGSRSTYAGRFVASCVLFIIWSAWMLAFPGIQNSRPLRQRIYTQIAIVVVQGALLAWLLGLPDL